MGRRRAGVLVAGASLAVASVGVIVSCGARTPLDFDGDTSSFLDASRGDVKNAFDGRDDSDTPDEPPPIPVACTPGQFPLTIAATRLMFVLDRSASMGASLDGQDPPNGASKWQVLRDALAQTILPFDQQIAMGAKFFPAANARLDPSNPGLACLVDNGVAVAPRRGNASLIIDTFQSTSPDGATPTSEALSIAASSIRANRSVARSIVLATDGAPNCNEALDGSSCVCATTVGSCAEFAGLCLDDLRTIETVRRIAETDGIPVYVIGMGNTERPEFLRVLDDMAVAGGQARPSAPRHYNVQTPAELASALTTIRDSASTCTYVTPSSPTDPNGMRVEIDGRPVPRDPTRKVGWDWLDQTYGTLGFFGADCERAQSSRTIVANVRCSP